MPEAEPRGARNGRRGRGLLLLGLALGPDLHFEALDAGLHPSEEEQAFGADGACADDARPPDVTAVLAQVRHVQRVRRERLPGEDTRPGQIADRRSLGEQAGRLGEIARRARAGVGNDAIRGLDDPAEQVALRTAAPDDDHREVRTQQAHHRGLQMAHGPAGCAQDDALHRDRAARAHHREASGERFLFDPLVGDHRDEPAGMQRSRHLQRLACLLVLRRTEEDGDEVERGDGLRRPSSALPRLPQQALDPRQIHGFVELHGELARVRCCARRDRLAVSVAHSLLHTLRSWASSSSAAAGPQVPAG